MSGLKTALSFSPTKVWLEEVTFIASKDVNDSSPITVHIVVAYSQDILSELLKDSSNEYFKKAVQIEKDNINNIKVLKWDIVKGQTLRAPINLKRVDAIGAVLFARYTSPGIHRASIGEQIKITVKLNKDDFDITSAQQIISLIDKLESKASELEK